MATVYGSQALAWRDYRGRSARTALWLYAADEATLVAQAAAVSTALVACSNAVNTLQTGLVVGKQGTPAWGAAAQYADCGQKLVITGLDNVGRGHRLAVPAPLATDFLNDETTMNSGDANVSALISILNAHWCSADDGKAPIAVVDGYFEDRRRKNSIGKWSRSATGTALQR